ncbi:hypothetical protein CMQ_7553 [Grosmannia clavigera kw1407]|uniref:Transcription factor Iwr1 domain-containing protein n=1 Tax=Grosmannia clavigera (strain kw1407 / UAMH 11150) TaxID=655863 RepID=F0XQ67_GROCL|nr:uncharacterized protein CMQ_7553 [Grosmannia clavigera kw1407]EFX00551.1 hypothetical protein CMQ_7553 [Grosmannia clavigera kw1407]
MSLPPQLIHVKRKRTEEGPVPSFLRIEQTTKRHRRDAFLYRRHDPVEAAARAARAAAAESESGTAAGRPPVIQTSPSAGKKRKKADEASIASIIAPQKEENEAGDVPVATLSVEPRRFHLSRETLLGSKAGGGSAPPLGVSGIAGIRKSTRYRGRSSSTVDSVVFIERSKRRHRIGASRGSISSRTENVAGSGQPASGGMSPAVMVEAPSPVRASTSTSSAPFVSRLPKRPSWRGPLRSASEASAGASTSPAGEVADEVAPGSSDKAPALPQTVSNRQWDTDMDRLTQEMNNYTLEIIGRNLARMDQEAKTAETRREAAKKRTETSEMVAVIAAEKRKAAYAKYKPKPVPRYAERQALAQDGADKAEGEDEDGTASNSDNGSETDDDDDYVTETYVRVPGHEVKQTGDAEPGSVGLLVFDNEPDIEVFYGAEEESSDEFDDDEDENAENYYTHDYPEDEVASDDEFDRDAYHYLTGNASDLEEFEESGDEETDKGFKGSVEKLFPGARFPGVDGI